MKKPVFPELLEKITSVGADLFERVVSIDKSLRPDDKERTGITILLIEENTRNLVFASVRNPSTATKFFVVEKMVRTSIFGNFTSQDNEDEALFRYAGCVAVFINGVKFYASVSGLKAEEDAAISIILLSIALEISVTDVLENIRQYGGFLPAFLEDKSHYLHTIYQF